MSRDRTHVGPVADFDELVALLGPDHPYNADTFANLHWYDGPIYSIVTVVGDDRPRLDVMVEDHDEGDGETRVFISVRHQLVFDRMEALQATLRMGCPTLESYRLSEHIVRYEGRMTRIGHPEPSHQMWTSIHTAETIPVGEQPNPGIPDGLAVPGVDMIEKEKKR